MIRPRYRVSKGLSGRWWVSVWLNWASCDCHPRYGWSYEKPYRTWREAMDVASGARL